MILKLLNWQQSISRACGGKRLTMPYIFRSNKMDFQNVAILNMIKDIVPAHIIEDNMLRIWSALGLDIISRFNLDFSESLHRFFSPDPEKEVKDYQQE